MTEDDFGVNINSSVRTNDFDEIPEKMSEEELDKYIEDNYGYIDHPEVK